MSDNTDLAIREPEFVESVAVSPVMSVDEAADMVKKMQEFRKRVLVSGIDYGKIPGVSKPTLFKPGAEKLANMFGLSIEFEVVEKIEDWDKPLFYYCYRCTVRSRANGQLVAQCDGSANSQEKKYKKQNPADILNTLQKMAQKRSMVGAVIIATRASEEYTQDVEDMDTPSHSNDSVEVPTTVPFGKDKGKLLTDCDDERLSSIRSWCEDKGKFPELIVAIEAILIDRGSFAEEYR